jgi:hypothetical protein
MEQRKKAREKACEITVFSIYTRVIACVYGPVRLCVRARLCILESLFYSPEAGN